MCVWSAILAQDGSGSELVYVIALLILGAAGAIFEKIKQKMGGSGDKSKRPTPQGRPGQPGQPAHWFG